MQWLESTIIIKKFSEKKTKKKEDKMTVYFYVSKYF
jgi:hypothetical protein